MNDPIPTAAAAEREIFAAAAALPLAEQPAYLDAACAAQPELRARVEEWLRAHQSSDFMAAEFARLKPEEVGEWIGPYKLMEQIGQGGFGTVWVADQEKPVRRRVALKIIKLGMDTKEVIARFEQERQALAMMDHPHIAKVFDAGATQWGRPFFVMELVRGIKITDYCDQANLPTEERLQLFIAVCQAVQHAHQKGIIHRDLKPSNILVTLHDGVPVPKVIDFGVAKATQPLGGLGALSLSKRQQRLTDLTIYTQFQQMIGTPLYMSPEQAEMSGLDIDTRSDIYSLGVLLYELLTGRTPFDPEELMKQGLDEIRRTIREQEPQTPSMFLKTMAEAARATVAEQRQTDPARLTNLLRGDLDWIVMKALEKDRGRRYETANGLAMDVRRHLNSEAVAARPPSNVYRFQKLVRRNKLAVAAASMVAGALIIGAAISIWQAIRATRAERAQIHLRQEAEKSRNSEARLRLQAEADEQRAITEAARSAQVAQFMQGMLSGVGPGVARGRDSKLLREILDQTVARLEELQAQPAVEADLRDTLGTVYRDLAEFPDAEAMHRQALALRRKLHGDEHASVATTLNHLGGVLHRQGNHPEAERVYRQALDMQRKLLGHEHRDVALTLNNLGSVLRIQGKLPEAESTLREALTMRRQLLGHEHVDVAESLKNLGLLVRAQGGDQTEAVALFRETLAMSKKLLGDDHPSTAESLGHLGRTVDWQGKLPEAEAMLRDSLALKKKLFGDEHPELVIALNGLVTVLSRGKKYAEAEPFQRELLALQKKLRGDEHPDVLTALTDLVGLLSPQGKHAEAEPIFREVIPLKTKLLGRNDPSVVTLLEAFGRALSDGGKLTEAESIYREALEMRRTVSGKHTDLIKTLTKIADLLAIQGRFAEAKAMFTEAIAAQKKLVGDEDRSVIDLLDAFGLSVRLHGERPEAEAILREAVAMRRRLFGNEDRDLTQSLYYLAPVVADGGKLVEAEAIARENLALRRKHYGNGSNEAGDALTLLGSILLNQRKFSEAEPIIREGAELGKRQSQFDLARMYRDGNGVPRDLVESVKWLCKAVEQGHIAALTDLAGLLSRLGKHADAEPIFREVIPLKTKLLGRNDPSVVTLLEAFGRALSDGGKLTEAESSYREALEIRRTVSGKHTDLIKTLTKTADLLAIQGRFTEAKALFTEAIAAQKKLVGEEDRSVIDLLDAFGLSVRLHGEMPEAEAILREAVAMRKRLFGNEERARIASLYSLGHVLADGGKLVEAEAIAREHLALRRKLDGNGSSNAGDALALLGSILLRQSKFSEAEPTIREAAELGIRRGQFDLACMYRDGNGVLHDLVECVKWFRKAAEQGHAGAQAHFGRMYATGEGVVRDTAEAAKWYRKSADAGDFNAQYILGKIYATGNGVVKDPAEAAKWYGKAANSSRASTLNEMAWRLATSIDAEERDAPNAVQFAEKAVAMTSPKDPNLLDTLAAAYAEAGQFEKAISVQKEAITLLQDEEQKKDYATRLKLYESHTPYRDSDWLPRRIDELLAAGKFVEAEPLARQCLAIREEQLPDHWRMYNAKSMLGASLLGQKNTIEAEPLLLSGYTGMKQREDKIPANGKGHLRKVLQRLVQLYATTARPEQAAEWKKKLTEFDLTEVGKKTAAPQP